MGVIDIAYTTFYYVFVVPYILINQRKVWNWNNFLFVKSLTYQIQPLNQVKAVVNSNQWSMEHTFRKKIILNIPWVVLHLVRKTI